MVPLMEILEVLEKNNLEIRFIPDPKPLCAAEPDCDQCETDVDCGGREEKQSGHVTLEGPDKLMRPSLLGKELFE